MYGRMARKGVLQRRDWKIENFDCRVSGKRYGREGFGKFEGLEDMTDTVKCTS